MIISVLSGGIGSQLCQYAAGFNLAKKNDSKLILDLCYFYTGNSNVTKPFKLDEILDVTDCILIKNIWISRLLRLYLTFIHLITFGKFKFSKIEIKNPLAKPKFDNAKNYFINGHANNFEYYEEYIHDILKKFIKTKIKKEKTLIGIHVRKGDQKNGIVDFCDKDYFKRSIDKLLYKKNLSLNDIELVIFCEEIEWPKKNISLNGVSVKYIIGDDETATSDFKQMINCEHMIIPNSYFSWWAAAYISYISKGIIICPDLWWDRVSVSNFNIYPKDWLIVKTNVEENKFPEYLKNSL